MKNVMSHLKLRNKFSNLNREIQQKTLLMLFGQFINNLTPKWILDHLIEPIGGCLQSGSKKTTLAIFLPSVSFRDHEDPRRAYLSAHKLSIHALWIEFLHEQFLEYASYHSLPVHPEILAPCRDKIAHRCKPCVRSGERGNDLNCRASDL